MMSSLKTMKLPGLLILALLLSISLNAQKITNPNALTTDVCILGGSEAGFTAAIQAARLGKKVILIEPTGHAGGMLVEALGKDIRHGSEQVIGGIAREFYVDVEKHYGRVPRFDGANWFASYEPSVAEMVIDKLMVKETNLTVIRKQRIKEQGGVAKKGTKIQSIVLENGQNIAAKVFIDASIEGHLLHFAGISTETIREGNQKYGEQSNGIRVKSDFANFPFKVDPYVVPGDPGSGLIRTIQPGALGEDGAPDKHIQGYCYRICLTDVPDNMIPVTKPDNYDPKDYEIYRRYLKAGGRLWHPTPKLPNRKSDLNSWQDLAANLYGENWRYPTGNYATQDSIVQYHRDFSEGLIWFMQNDPSVDSLSRSQWKGWGLPKDEFADNGHWPRRLYIRTARRMVSDYIVTERHSQRDNPERVPDPVTVAWWSPDMHHARRIVKDGYAFNEGSFFGGDNWRPYGVSLRALAPKRQECTNLISPTCPSSSYVTYSTIRIAPTFTMLGQSAGAMASVAIDGKTAVQDIPYPELKKTLVRHGQILDIPKDWLKTITANSE